MPRSRSSNLLPFLSFPLVTLLALFGSALAVQHAHAKVVSRTIEYKAGGITMQGYIAYDDASSAKRPGVLVVHEWWGLNDYARDRARQLAELGYVALAVDMYGDGKTADHPDDAGTFAKAVMSDPEGAKERFEAAREVLAAQPQTDAEKIAAIGYCFGGATVLNMARSGMPLGLVASFHGSLATPMPAKEGAVKARVLVYHGADDTFISEEHIEAFHQEMNDAGADYVFESYPGALHGFSNPGATAAGEKFGLPLAYQKEADEKSWNSLLENLVSVFGKP